MARRPAGSAAAAAPPPRNLLLRTEGWEAGNLAASPRREATALLPCLPLQYRVRRHCNLPEAAAEAAAAPEV